MPEAIQVKKKADSKPWKDICCARCFVAKSERKKCKCHCHGMHHGEAIQKKIGQSQRIDDGSMSLDGGKTTSNRADGKSPWEPYHP